MCVKQGSGVLFFVARNTIHRHKRKCAAGEDQYQVGTHPSSSAPGLPACDVAVVALACDLVDARPLQPNPADAVLFLQRMP